MSKQSFWAWGDASRLMDTDSRRGLAQLVGLQTGIDDLSPIPFPKIEHVLAPDPRRSAPSITDAPITSDRETRIRHTYGRNFVDIRRGLAGDFASAPDLVGLPKSEEQARRTLEWCDAQNVIVIPYGGGTSVVGGVEPPRDRDRPVLSLDLCGLDQVVEVDPISRQARIQAGAKGPSLEKQLAAHGLTLRFFPQSFEFSTLGGWIATRAGGHFATLQTHIDDLLAATRAITPAGTVETRALPASGAGPSADRLLLGSEGALGLITEATVRVRPRPRFKVSASVHFPTFAEGVLAARGLAQSDLHPSNCRLLDETEARLNNVTNDGSAVLVVGFESDDHDLEPWMRRALEICAASAGTVRRQSSKSTATDAGDRWKSAFVDAPYLHSNLVSLGLLVDTFETACTWSGFDALDSAVLQAVQGALEEECGGGLVTRRFTHVYSDGPAPYYTFVGKADADAAAKQWLAVKQAASDVLIKEGATITHHHAVGRLHRPWYQQQVSPLFLDVLRAAKGTVDPNGIMNPGVLFEGQRRIA